MKRGPPQHYSTTNPRHYNKKKVMKMYRIKIRIGKMFWHPLITVYHLAVIGGIVGCVWVVASFIEIFFKNLNPDSVYSAWNYFAAIVR